MLGTEFCRPYGDMTHRATRQFVGCQRNQYGEMLRMNGPAGNSETPRGLRPLLATYLGPGTTETPLALDPL